MYYCHYHLVLVTKDRRKVFNAGIQAYLSNRMREIRQYYPELEFVEIQHDQDHLHLLVVIPPKLAVGKAVGISKATTSKRLKEVYSRDTCEIRIWGKKLFVLSIFAH